MGLTTRLVFNALPGLPGELASATNTTEAARAAALVPLAQAFCPVSAGPWTAKEGEEAHVHMRDTITADGAATVAAKDYAIYVHQGTIHMAARPFLTQAADAQHGADVEAFSGVVPTAARAAGAH